MKISFPKIKIPQIKLPPIPKIKFKFIREGAPNPEVIMEKYADFLVNLNSICSLSKNLYQGRDKEVDQIFNSLLKSNNPNVVLLGDRGTGKSSTLNSAIYRIIEKKCPKELENSIFIYFDIERILAYCLNSAEVSRRIVAAIEEIYSFFAAYNNLVIVIDQIHMLVTFPLLLYHVNNLLNLPNVKVIGMSTPEDFYEFFAYETSVIAKLDVINIVEPKPKKIYSMISKFVENLEEIHGISISEDMVNYTISISGAFDSEIRNPGLTINLIEKSMIYAKNNNRNEVTRKDVNSNFNFNYELFNEMTDEDKKITAYHEAGHFIISRFSENIRNYKTTAITIVPSEYFLGVTLFEFEPEKQSSLNFDYFIDSIAVDLGGRVAETLLKNGQKNNFTSGASSDLKNATQTARDIITEFGMIESSKNVSYFCNYDLSDIALLSEERKKIIDDETHKLVEMAFNRATDILSARRDLLDLIATKLLENDVLDYNDLEKLCNQENAAE